MNIQLHVSDQSAVLEDYLKANLYRTCYEGAKQTLNVRFLGFPVGVAAGVLTVAKRVALIAEAIFKGAINVLGSPVYSQCEFSTGLRQLAIDFPKNLLILPFSCFSAALGLVTETLYIATDPLDYAYDSWIAHDPVEVERQKKASQQRQQQEQIAAFQEATQRAKTHPQDVEALKFLAHCYEKGIGTEADAAQACDYSLKAVEKGDVDSMLKLGRGLYDVKDEKQLALSLRWYQEAAGKGNIEAMMILAKHYETAGNYPEAFVWYKTPVQYANPEALLRYGVLLVHGKGVAKNVPEGVRYLRASADKGNALAQCYLEAILFHREDLRLYPTEAWNWQQKVLKREDYPSETHAGIRLEMESVCQIEERK